VAVVRDISRSRKAYSYYRPRPRPVLITTEDEMNTITATINKVANLDSLVARLVKDDINIVWNEAPLGTVDGTNVTFMLEFTPINDRVLVFVNGVLQDRDSGEADFYLTGRTITFNRAPRSGSKVLVTYNKA
jgi:hypothetical protein